MAAGLSLLLYGPCGVWGIPLANSIANAVVVPLLWLLLSRRVGALDNRGVLTSTVRSLVGAIIAAGVALGVWTLLHGWLGEALFAQLISVGVAISVAGGLYLGGMFLLRVPEAQRMLALIRRRPEVA